MSPDFAQRHPLDLSDPRSATNCTGRGRCCRLADRCVAVFHRRQSLRRYSKCPLGGKPTGEFRQDGQIDVEPHALQAAYPQRQHRPLVLEPSELALTEARTRGFVAVLPVKCQRYCASGAVVRTVPPGLCGIEWQSARRLSQLQRGFCGSPSYGEIVTSLNRRCSRARMRPYPSAGSELAPC
jgi:hypothetical protein